MRTINAFINNFINERRLRSSRKVIVGAANTVYEGWASTNYKELDLLNKKSFSKYWKEGSRTHFLAEHVWEHLTPADGLIAALNCFDFLQHKGRLRIAVPDGLHPDKEYINYVKPGGFGAGSDDHKILYNYITLSKLLTKAGFDVELLEYWDEEGNFIVIPWNVDDGMFIRSLKYDNRNKNGNPNYTSLIIDAIKP